MLRLCEILPAIRKVLLQMTNVENPSQHFATVFGSGWFA